MEAKTRVWLPRGDQGDAWVAAEILSQAEDGRCSCLTLDGEEGVVPREQLEMREVLSDDGADDLTSLSYLHEPAILNNLLVRFNAAGGEGKGDEGGEGEGRRGERGRAAAAASTLTAVA